MIQTVLKRDGRVVGYNEEKIKAAIRKAMLATEAGEDESLIQRIADRIGQRGRAQIAAPVTFSISSSNAPSVKGPVAITQGPSGMAVTSS